MVDISPLNKLKSAIQYVGFHYIVCVKAKPSNLDTEIYFGNKGYGFDSIASLDRQYLHWEFQRWASNVVLRDLIEYFSIFLFDIYDDLYKEIVKHKLEDKFPISPIQFERYGIENQLNYLAEKFLIDSRWIELIVDYNRVRNCYAHRAGFVGNKDLTNGTKLTVKWLKPTVTQTETAINQTMPVTGVMNDLMRLEHIHGNMGIECDVQTEERSFYVGDLISFKPDEVFDIILTFVAVGQVFSMLDLTILK